MKFIATLDGALDFLTPEEMLRASVITDPRQPDNPIVFVTPAFERRTGYARAELLGRNCRILQGEGTDPQEVARLRDAVWAMRPATASLLNYRRDGRPFLNTFSIRPCFGPGGELRSFVAVDGEATEDTAGTLSIPQRIGAALSGLPGRFARPPVSSGARR
jgi:PAS domain S-box-containing protein